ncbi:MAG TPA: hypothetical protein VFW73_09945 [Lacipirellulaceae bacterium]|nr:hypothetical protein [Lacipirellulaceae bacterium]
MSNAYLDAITASVDAATRSGSRAYLYDEDRWPSGWAGGAVPIADPNFRVKALVRRPESEVMDDNYRLFASVSEFRYYVFTMPLGHPKFNGTCYIDIADPDAVRCFLEEAYEPLKAHLGNAFGRATPAIFTDEPALTYLYTWPKGGLPWTRQLPQRYFDATGIRLADVVDSLFDERSESAWVRIQYYRTLAEMFGESFMRQVSNWCREHGIHWTGHFMYEHSLPLHFSWSANCHSAYRFFDWPGVDHLGRQVGEVVTAIGCRSAVHQFNKKRMMSELYGASGQNLSFVDRKWIAEQQIVLGANHLVPHLSSTTLLGPRKRDYPPTISTHQPWWPLNAVVEDHLARLCELLAPGVAETDLLVIHPQESVYVLSDGPVAVGDASTWVGRFFHPSPDARIANLDHLWKTLAHRLLDMGYVFDFGDEQVLANEGFIAASNNESRICIGAASYRAVLIPSLVTIRPSTVKLLKDFLRTGGIVIHLGQPPTMLDGRSDDIAQQRLQKFYDMMTARCNSSEDLQACLLYITPPALRIEAGLGMPPDSNGRVWRYTKCGGDYRLSLIVNLNRKSAKDVRLTWRQPPSQPVALWQTDLEMSERLTVNHGRAVISLPSGGSCVIVEGEAPPIVPRVKRIERSKHFIDATSLDWRVSRLDKNALVIDHAEFHRGDEKWAGPYPVLAIKEWLNEQRYSGPLFLRYTFETDILFSELMPLELIVEGAERSEVKVRVNERELDTSNIDRSYWLDHHWHPIELKPESIRNRNCIEIQIKEFEFGDPTVPEADRRLGTDVESLMILGDFSVDGASKPGPQNWQGQLEYHTTTPLSDWLPLQRLYYLAPPFVLRAPRTLATGDVASQGLPFYAGRIRYETDLIFPDSGEEETILRFGGMAAAVASVEVNGMPIGTLAWAPFEINVLPFLKTGKNQISLTLYGSLRNLLGPHHHPDGEPAYVTPASFRPERCADWLGSLCRGLTPPDWNEDYAFVEFGWPSLSNG